MRDPMRMSKGEGNDLARCSVRVDPAGNGGGHCARNTPVGSGGAGFNRDAGIDGVGSVLGRPCGLDHGGGDGDLDGFVVCQDWCGNTGTVGPAEKARRARSLPACAKSDDLKRAVFIVGRGVNVAVLADRGMGAVLLRRQHDLFTA